MERASIYFNVLFIYLLPFCFFPLHLQLLLFHTIIIVLLSSYNLKFSHNFMLAGSNGIGFIPHVIDVRAGEVENLHKYLLPFYNYRAHVYLDLFTQKNILIPST